MNPNIIKRKLVEKIYNSPSWFDKLGDTDPGHYGLEDWSVQLSEEDLIVNIHKRTFYFKDAEFSFEVMLGSSNPDDGFLSSFSREAKGSGTLSLAMMAWMY